MPVPSSFADLSETPGSNSPAGSESVGPNMNAYIQAAYAFIKQMYDGAQTPTAPVSFNGQKITNIANGTAATDGVAFGQLANYLALATGGTVTAPVTINSIATNAFTVQASTGSQGANMLLYDAASNTKKYIRCLSNSLHVINNAYTAVIATIDDAGNFTASGNVTAYSDERLKKDWESVGDHFVDGLAALKSGIFTRTDTGQRQAGVSAQSLEKLLAEAVIMDYHGVKSVAYGQAALVACVELAKEVVALRLRVEQLESV